MRRRFVLGALGLAVATLVGVPGCLFTAPEVGSDAVASLHVGSSSASPAAIAKAPTVPASGSRAAGAASGTSSEPAPDLPSWTSAHCTGGSLVVVAHTDDDLLFINPEQQRAIKAGSCLHTVYVTAGDAGQSEQYWSSRERGAKAAYAFMAGVADDWEERTISSRGLRMLTLKADWRINLIYMRLPDGMQRGTGAKSNKGQSLKKLWNGNIATVTAVDGTNTYTKKQLTETLTELMRLTSPATIRTLDYVNSFSDSDHADHHAVAYLTRQASKQYKARHELLAYQGYTIASKKANLSADEARIKLAAFDTYAEYDYVGQNRKYIPRQYVVSKSA